MIDRSFQRHRNLYLWTFVLLLIAVCVGVSYITASLMTQDKEWGHNQSHQWLHEDLGLNEAEAGRIDVFETDYRASRNELQTEFDLRIAELSDILRNNNSYSEDVTHVVHQLHEVHGKLQQLSIEHYYEMLSVLPSDKQAKLRDLAIEALSEPE